eukprot:TRINITY_DN1394_c0_g1_i8.p1 TRINITY_DN1394_c0_g1~~TRINITY_DN1394_c0_g1_i8.p1  ORF type:complete len:224 (-),score=51.26 TRINITY_DN1394_c0_g1_i8:44-715(-)
MERLISEKNKNFVRIRKCIKNKEMVYEHPSNIKSSFFMFMVLREKMEDLYQFLVQMVPSVDDRQTITKVDELTMHSFWREEFEEEMLVSNCRAFESSLHNFKFLQEKKLSPLISNVQFWKGGNCKNKRRIISNVCSITSLSKRESNYILDSTIKTKDLQNFLVHFEHSMSLFKEEKDLPLLVVNCDVELAVIIKDLFGPYLFYTEQPFVIDYHNEKFNFFFQL